MRPRTLGGVSRSSLDGPAERPADALGAFHEPALELGVSPRQLCPAWLLTRSPTVIPVPGASRPRSIRDSAAAAGLTLTEDRPTRLDESVRRQRQRQRPA
ncbi:aldo/keto reductase [Streptomyces zaehneri]|uniref:aldo/keto reductase n=1 Tax=Streptomyces zaehneri TaxID=3051180 RepID=UPI0028D500CE|nr:aldo/keto reductase [Streptomyces sp. DSM 40713]